MADPILGAAWSHLDPVLQFMILILALALGAILVFVGKLLWKPFMSILGGFIGGVVGFVVGFILGGMLGGLVGAMIGGFLGSLVFALLVEFALAILTGIIAFVIIIVMTESTILALIVGFVVLVLVAIFVEGVIGILTAIVGGLIVGVSLMGLGVGTELTAIIALILMIAGSLVQTIFVKDKSAHPQHAPACPRCGG